MSELVTIIIPVYNCEKYIQRCLTCALNQTYKKIEIICIDDASTDSSWRLIKDFFYKTKNDRLTCIKLKKNVGVYKIDNFALTLASGYYICINDSDDFSTPNRVEKSLKFLKSEKADIVGGRIKVLDEDGAVLRGKALKKRRHYYWKFKPPYNVNRWLRRHPYKHAVYNPTMLLRKEIFNELGGYDNTRIGGDTELIGRAFFKFKIRNSKEIYAHKTLRPDSLTQHPDTCLTSPKRQKYAEYRRKMQKIRIEYLKKNGFVPKKLLFNEPNTSGVYVSERLSF
ncbi:MAG: glycosyltransferase family 2 protein [Candidatus Hydrothermarchaeales archaeon]